MKLDKHKRLLLKAIAQLGTIFYSWPLISHAQLLAVPSSKKFIIPKSKEPVFPIGMGTWITFNVGNDALLRQQRTEVVKTFFALGGQLIDSSPMYASAEEVLGYTLKQLPQNAKLFSATKIWTNSKQAGQEQFNQSQKLWYQTNFALLQIHNLVAWQKHLPLLQELKKEGLIRYIGVTTSHGRRHSELKKIITTQDIDFIQLTYNIADREAEQELLPLAQDKGLAIIANRPLQGGRLMDRFENEQLPSWAKELGCNNWAQFFLRFIISHPAITYAIPATSRVEHMKENMLSVNKFPLPNQTQRQRMISYLKEI